MANVKVEVWLHSFLTQTGRDNSRLLRPGKGPRFPLNRRLDEFHSRYGRFWQRASLPVQPVASRYADCALLAPELNDLRSKLMDFAIYMKSDVACEGAAV